jgi:hypothetical protein
MPGAESPLSSRPTHDGAEGGRCGRTAQRFVASDSLASRCVRPPPWAATLSYAGIALLSALWVARFLLAAASLAFAPAPLPRRDREPGPPGRRAARKCESRLRELGVTWRVEARDGAPHVRFETGGEGHGYFCRVGRAGLPETLGMILRFVERLRSNPSANQ